MSTPASRVTGTGRATRLLPDPVVRAARTVRRAAWRLDRRPVPAPPRPAVADRPVRLLVGPANFAGQADAWAVAAREHLAGVGSVSMAVDRGGPRFPADYRVPARAYRSPRWTAEQRAWLGSGFTHVLVDGMRPVTGALAGEDCSGELAWLRSAGLRVALVAHGSDVRLPSRHRELYPHSPFDPSLRATQLLEHQAGRLGAVIRSYDGPTFVSTPDLLDFVPAARWLPVVVAPDGWVEPARPALQRERPVVLHVPTNPWLKGSAVADAELRRLAADGLIDYRRLEGVPPDEVRRQVLDADVVLDQLVLGLYSAAAVQAMHAGRLALGHVHERVRARVGRALPIAEVTPETLAEVVREIARDPAEFAPTAAAGPAFAAEVHDGRASARVLAGFLGVDAG
jgi:hypothetical protein